MRPVSDPAPTPSTQTWTVRRVLEWTTGHLQKHGSETPRLEAEILLSHARKCKRIELYTNYDTELTDAIRATMRDLVNRRAKREPVAYLVGYREFFSLEFRVTSDVLIPRPETETLVMEALGVLKTLPTPMVLDLCTGSGCVAVAIAKNCPTATVTATDVSPNAIAIATENAAKHKVSERVTFRTGDLLAALPDEAKFDVMVSNPPYIPSAEIATLDADVQQYEPRLALDGGSDGLDIIRRILVDAPAHLKPDGWLMCEFTPEQAPTILALAQQHGYADPNIVKDTASQPRFLLARIPS
jgi:release factor glutamine methyltransferase